MKRISTVFVALAIVIAAWLTLSSAANAPVLQPDKLVILSTTDVKGETSPCG
jgi:hypothetical protein